MGGTWRIRPFAHPSCLTTRAISIPTLQSVARRGPEAVSVRLGARSGASRAQLDGFKSRGLRAEAPTRRHLYTTEWSRIDVAGGVGAKVLVISDDGAMQCERLSSRVLQAELVAALHQGKWAAIVVSVATERGSLAVSALFALEVALALVKTQVATTPAPNVWLVMAGSPEHAGTVGFSRSARAEASLPLVCMQTAVATVALALGPSLAEPEAVLHERKACAPRLTTTTPSFAGLFRLHLHARGAISNLFVEPLPALPRLGDGEVLLRVGAVGLNFRDVLNVLGEYPGDPGPPGGDVAGVVGGTPARLFARRGRRRPHRRPGDRVGAGLCGAGGC